MNTPSTVLTLSAEPQVSGDRWGSRKHQIVEGVRSGERPSDVARRLGITLEWVRQTWLNATGEPLPRETDGDRFWARVNKDGPTNTRRPELGPCWIWTGSTYSHKGRPTYGQTTYAGHRMPAHKASFLMHGGIVPDGHDVMHRCDTKPCVRFAHLTTGTRSENLRDGFASPANRGVCGGENNGRAVLNWDIVHDIRSGGEKTGVLALRYGVSPNQITNIKGGRKWPESKCPVHGTAREDVAA